jgi:ribonuclease J
MTENKNIQVSTLVSELEKRIEVKKIEVKKEVIKKKIYDAPHPTSIFALGGLEEIGKKHLLYWIWWWNHYAWCRG